METGKYLRFEQLLAEHHDHSAAGVCRLDDAVREEFARSRGQVSVVERHSVSFGGNWIGWVSLGLVCVFYWRLRWETISDRRGIN